MSKEQEELDHRKLIAHRMIGDMLDFKNWITECQEKVGINLNPENAEKLLLAIDAMEEVSKKVPAGLMFQVFAGGALTYLRDYVDYVDNKMPAQTPIDDFLERVEREMNEKGKV